MTTNTSPAALVEITTTYFSVTIETEAAGRQALVPGASGYDLGRWDHRAEWTDRIAAEAAAHRQVARMAAGGWWGRVSATIEDRKVVTYR